MRKSLKTATLTVFSTFKVGLSTHAQTGSLDREMALYVHLAKYLKKINIITYGGSGDETYKKDFPQLTIIPLTAMSFFPNSLYCLPQLLTSHYNTVSQTDVMKTNQIVGSEIAVWLKQTFHKKLITRCGYLYSEFAQKNNRNIKQAFRIEKQAFKKADYGIVTTQRQSRHLLETYQIPAEKIGVIPNYVDTALFKPLPVKKEYDLVYVGRGAKQKNLENLLKALYILKRKRKVISLLMIGGCDKEQALHDLVKKYKLNVTFSGYINSNELPKWLNKAKVFILPSLFEGHPKALLEAMSCGLPVIGTDVEGIRDEIKNKSNGLLCPTTAQGISDTIASVIKNKILQKQTGTQARKYIVNSYDLKKVLNLELDVLEKVLFKNSL